MFVDENLDRLLPISKQPKDKVQAILDACERQFPEFVERSRKRLRTYLKSCRRIQLKKNNTKDFKCNIVNSVTISEVTLNEINFIIMQIILRCNVSILRNYMYI